MSRVFGPIRQNGYVVRDIRAAIIHWVDVHGVGPWFFVEKVQTDWFRYHGADSPLDMTVALANSGDLQIELIQQNNDAPSLYRDFLEAGHEGLQHVAYWSTDYQAMLGRALAAGYRVGHEGQIGGEQGRFCYFESDAHPGSLVEISDISGNKGRFFEHIRRAAADWDGSNPIRLVK